MSTGIKKLMEPTDELPPCDKEIYHNGETVTIIWGGSAKLIDRFIKELAEYSGEPVDWHFVGGRAVVLTTGNMEKVKKALNELRFFFYSDM